MNKYLNRDIFSQERSLTNTHKTLIIRMNDTQTILEILIQKIVQMGLNNLN